MSNDIAPVSPDSMPVIGEIADGVGDARLEQFSPRGFDRGAALAAGFGEARILG